MSWILYIWIGYAGSHSTVIQHGQFKTEQDCFTVGSKAESELDSKKTQQRLIIRYSCLPKEKNSGSAA